MPTNKKKREKHRNFWKLSSHVGKTTFFHKNTSRIIAKVLPKTIQNTSNMEPKKIPKRSRTPSRKYAAPTKQKSQKRPQKITSKINLKSEKNRFGRLFFQLKKKSIFWNCFSFLLLSPGGPGPWKSSQNAIKVCKNEGSTFSPKTSILIRIVPKMTSLGTLKTSQNFKKTEKGSHKNDL